MKAFLARLLFVALYVAVGAFAYPLSVEETDRLMGIVRPAELLKAAVIITGHVESIKHVKDGTLMRAGSPVPVGVAEISVNVLEVLKGEQIERVHVGNFLSSDNLQLQTLESNKTYVFFLSKAPSTKLEPVSPYRFALPFELSPGTVKATNSVIELLRNIAKANVAATNNSVAEIWAKFLEGLYDKNEDFAFWTNKMNDSRIAIKVIALETVAENSPQTSGVCPEIMRFLQSSNAFSSPLTRHRLFQLLPKVATADEPSAMELQNWMRGSQDFQMLALRCIQATRNMALMPTVVQLMRRSDNSDIQYECLKALYSLSGNRSVLSYPTFLKQPDKYMQEWETK